ncbi:HD domain-containing protein [Streptomyces thermolilacinus]
MPPALDTPQGAAELAESLLSPCGDRWLRTRAVAARAREAAAAVPETERDLLVAAAWLHDIGYAPELRDTGFHPLDGARHLEALGAPTRLVRLVARQPGAVYEAEQRGLSAEPAVHERENSPVLDALIFADLTTGPAGQSLDFGAGADQILGRYEPGSEAHDAISEALPYLQAAVQRTLDRLSTVLGLLGFYDEFESRPGQPNGSIRDAVRSVGEPDEARLVAYLDAGHVLLDVMEGGRDVLTGEPHRHSAGCSSLYTDGAWLWRQDLPHYVETHHVRLPDAFLDHVRALDHRMPPLVTERFAPYCNATLPLVGWGSAVPWRATVPVIEPRPRLVTSKAEFDAARLAGARSRPHGRWARPRKRRG